MLKKFGFLSLAVAGMALLIGGLTALAGAGDSGPGTPAENDECGTATPSATPELTPTPTSSPVGTPTATASPTPTATPTSVPTPTPTAASIPSACANEDADED